MLLQCLAGLSASSSALNVSSSSTSGSDAGGKDAIAELLGKSALAIMVGPRIRFVFVADAVGDCAMVAPAVTDRRRSLRPGMVRARAHRRVRALMRVRVLRCEVGGTVVADDRSFNCIGCVGRTASKECIGVMEL
jgi:hypothetical protein